nr:HNH endonuclease [Actinomyces urogenitalis]
MSARTRWSAVPERAGRDNREYRRRAHALKRRVARENLPCWLCGRRINTALPASHPMAFTADHVRPLKDGGALLGALKPAHRSCNSRRGNASAATMKIFKPLRLNERW